MHAVVGDAIVEKRNKEAMEQDKTSGCIEISILESLIRTWDLYAHADLEAPTASNSANISFTISLPAALGIFQPTEYFVPGGSREPQIFCYDAVIMHEKEGK